MSFFTMRSVNSDKKTKSVERKNSSKSLNLAETVQTYLSAFFSDQNSYHSNINCYRKSTYRSSRALITACTIMLLSKQ